METLLLSLTVTALAEIGDKTQLLALVLASRFRQPRPILMGILLATLVNHALAGALGMWLTSVASPDALRWGLGLSFLGLAAWMLTVDSTPSKEPRAATGIGAFGTTVIGFLLAELGDKTQLVTVALTARYGMPLSIVVGSSLGVLLADAPVVLAGSKLAGKLPVRLVQATGAATLALLGIATFIATSPGQLY